ncbi:uncharacterized protein [Palaemon carinicauda]|uniref:uncharacterized protein n=1 Tax=Palaemon carinicauda TaxID=392227 RepID=UPI0035B59DF1
MDIFNRENSGASPKVQRTENVGKRSKSRQSMVWFLPIPIFGTMGFFFIIFGIIVISTSKSGASKVTVTTGVILLVSGESWWWNDEVQERVKTKKNAKKKSDLCGQEQDKENYKQAKKETRRAVAKAKPEILNEMNKEKETPGEKKILRIAKARDTVSEDLTQIRQIKESNGILLAEENEIKGEKLFLEGLLNEENLRTVFEDGLPNETVNIGLTRRVEQAVKKMKNIKAAGPDNIPVEVWESL